MAIRGAPTAATQTGTITNGNAGHYTWASGSQMKRIYIENQTSVEIVVKLGGDSSDAAALDDWTFRLADKASKEVTVRVDRLSIYFNGAGTFTFGTTFVVLGWFDAQVET